MSERYRFRVRQGGMTVASGDAPSYARAAGEAMHYAAMYGQDGPLELVEVRRVRPRKPSPPKAEADHGG